MLIRWANKSDKSDWILLAKNVAHIFGNLNMPTDRDFHEYMDGKLSKYEALIAVDRMTKDCLGIIGFSRTYNRITWFGVFEKHRRKGIGSKILKCALNQLDSSKEITVETYRDDYELGAPARNAYHKNGFVDVDNTLFDHLGNPRCKMVIVPIDKKQGGSFHYKYDQYAKWSKKENCPVCQGVEDPYPPVLIKEMEYSWLECSIYDMSSIDMSNFKGDVQKSAEALHKITNAVKINYEIHGNSLPHLHVHLFPRYLDDNFPSAPIDYRVTEPSPYENEEFQWFVEQMRNELNI